MYNPGTDHSQFSASQIKVHPANPPPKPNPPPQPMGSVYPAPVHQQPTGAMHNTNTTVVIQQQPAAVVVRGPREWSSGLCACFDDCGVCKSRRGGTHWALYTSEVPASVISVHWALNISVVRSLRPFSVCRHYWALITSGARISAIRPQLIIDISAAKTVLYLIPVFFLRFSKFTLLL